MNVHDFVEFTVFGLTAGGIFFVSASGLVVTYATTGVFNFAHGAIGMMAAFLYWQLTVESGWPALLVVVLIVVVIAPLFGLLIERLLIRGLYGASLATTLVVTVGLLVGLIGIAGEIWEPQRRVVSPFFKDGGFELFGIGFFQGGGSDLFGVPVTWHRAITFFIAVAVAVGLRILLYNTRIGTTMRATVDDRDLVALNGARPAWAGAAAWALGASLAALAGILLASAFSSLDIIVITLLVVDAYAAAVVGRLRSLPMTFLGAMILGLLVNYTVGYLPFAFADDRLPRYLQALPSAIPAIMLFVVLLLLPQARLRGSRLISASKVKVASLRSSLLGGVLLVAAALLVVQFASTDNLFELGKGLGLALVVLSLLPLTGYAGQVSLGQLAFAGVGAWAMVEFGDTSPWLGLLMAVAITAAVGAIVSLPALRLDGLYLALMTLAFAVFMEVLIFRLESILGPDSNLVPRLDLPGLNMDSQGTYFVFMAVVYALLAIGILAMRRAAFGRRLIAMRDSPAACATLGMSTNRTKLLVFTMSAAIAGLGGAVYWGFQGTVTAVEFTMVASLVVLLLAVIGGVSTASGALLGGLFFAIVTIISQEIPELDWLPAIAPAVVGISLARNPDGAVAEIAARLRDQFLGRRTKADGDGEHDPLTDLDATLPLGADLTPVQIEALDRELAIEEVSVGSR